MRWIKTRDSGETQNVLETVEFSESVYLGLCGNQEKWSMKFPNHCRLVLKIKHVLWPTLQMELAGILFYLNILPTIFLIRAVIKSLGV